MPLLLPRSSIQNRKLKIHKIINEKQKENRSQILKESLIKISKLLSVSTLYKKKGLLWHYLSSRLENKMSGFVSERKICPSEIVIII